MIEGSGQAKHSNLLPIRIESIADCIGCDILPERRAFCSLIYLIRGLLLMGGVEGPSDIIGWLVAHAN